MGCSSVWVAHPILGPTSTNSQWVALQCGLLILFRVKAISKGHGLLFSVGYSCPFGSNQHKLTWVALQCGLLMPIWVKPVQMDMGCSSVWVTHAHLGQTRTNSMGCSSVWVTHAILGQNHIKRTWVALQCGLLMPIWVKTLSKRHGLLFSVGCSSCFGSNHYK